MAAHRVAVIGLGYFSQFHLRAWQAIEQTELIAICDQDEAKLQYWSGKLGVTAFANATDMLDAIQPDIVDIVAPPPAHLPIIEQAVLTSKLMICQKPFCRNLDEAEAAIDAANHADCPLIVHENFRFQPWHREIKRQLNAGLLGRVYQAHFSLRPGDGRGKDAYLNRQPSFQKMQRFLIHETGVHLVDLFRWMFGDIRSVFANLRQLNPAIAGEDAGLLLMEHTGGTQTVFDGNRLADHVSDNPRRTMGELVIEGEHGTLRLDGYGKLHFRRFGEAADVGIPIENSVDEDAFGGGCVEALCRHAVSALDGQAALENPASDYVEVMRAVEAAYRSNEEGKKILLS